jgi:AcrR family transcriptional regulator
MVRVALDALADAPAEKLSLRQVAQELDVSHQAPYVHFGSRRGFLAAVAGAGLDEAAQQAAAAVADAGADPVDRLHALARSYLTFIRTRPHVHDLAYGPAVAKSDHPLLQQAAITYWSLLHDTVASCQPADIAEEEVLRRSAVVWGAVYGIARLGAFHQIPESVPSDVDALVDATLDALVTGWKGVGSRSGRPTPRARRRPASG